MGMEELPPRARRILAEQLRTCQHLGTTSACAENTTQHHDWGVCPGNYLRVRGEYLSNDFPSAAPKELPPRARRIHAGRVGTNVRPGTTSACAENTVSNKRSNAGGRNYLRVRGEYTVNFAGLLGVAELPPRARRIP